MKKIIIFTLAFCLLLSFGVAVEADSLDGELIIDAYTSDPAPRAAMNEMVETFQEMHPDLDIELNITAHEDFKHAIRTWLASDTPPDVFTWFAGERAEYFVRNNLIRDITHIWEEEGLFDLYAEGYQRESIFDDKAYFLPHQTYIWGVFYNQEIFADLGLEEPETWDELIEVNETLKENDITPFTIGSRYEWTTAGWFDHLNIRINGFDFHQEFVTGEVPMTDDRVVKVFEKWKELIESDYFIEYPASYSWHEALEYMEDDEAAMYLMGSFIHDSATDELSEKLSFFPFPAIEKSPTAVEAPIDGYMMPVHAQNVEAGEEFLRFAASVEGQQNWVEDVGRVVPNPNVPEESYDEETLRERELIDGAEGIAQFLDRDMEEDFAITMMGYLVEFWENPEHYMDILERLEDERQFHFEQ